MALYKIGSNLLRTSGGATLLQQPSGGGGNIINAASASQADVEAAIALADPGDTVVVPAGTASWNTGGGFTISGITLKGPGKDAGSPLNVTAGVVTLVKHADEMTTLRGIRFTGNNQHFDVNGDSADTFFRIFDNYFYINGAASLGEINVNGGLVSQNEFDWDTATWQNGGNPIHVTLGAGAAANAAWAAAPTFGTDDTDGLSNVYMENNTFTCFRDGVPDVDDGGKLVFRYNTMNDSCVMCHGGGSGGSGNDSSQYGARQFEVYNNTFNRILDGTNDAFNQWVFMRGATGVIANNTFDNPSTSEYPGKPDISLGVGNCAAGYPRQYQVGQGEQVADATPDYPLLIYGNTVLSHSLDISREANPNTTCANPTSMIVEDRDYKLSADWWTAYTYPHPLTPDP